MKQLIGCLSIILFFLLDGCQPKGGPVLYTNVTGRAGEMIVVMSKVAWDDLPGNLIRNTLAQPQLSLPQEEPLFDLINVPHEAFKDIFLTTRNIIQTKISPIVENPVTFSTMYGPIRRQRCRLMPATTRNLKKSSKKIRIKSGLFFKGGKRTAGNELQEIIVQSHTQQTG